MSEPILYQTEDGLSRLQLRAQDGNVWLSQAEIAERFATTKQNVGLHAKNIVEEGVLDDTATVEDSLTVQTGGKRQGTTSVTCSKRPSRGWRLTAWKATRKFSASSWVMASFSNWPLSTCDTRSTAS